MATDEFINKHCAHDYDCIGVALEKVKTAILQLYFLVKEYDFIGRIVSIIRF